MKSQALARRRSRASRSFLLGVRAFLDPVAASAGFGLPMHTDAETTFVRIYGARNALLGALALTFVALGMIRPLASALHARDRAAAARRDRHHLGSGSGTSSCGTPPSCSSSWPPASRSGVGATRDQVNVELSQEQLAGRRFGRAAGRRYGSAAGWQTRQAEGWLGTKGECPVHAPFADGSPRSCLRSSHAPPRDRRSSPGSGAARRRGGRTRRPPAGRGTRRFRGYPNAWSVSDSTVTVASVRRSSRARQMHRTRHPVLVGKLPVTTR